MASLLVELGKAGLKFLGTKQSQNKTVLGGAITVLIVYGLEQVGISLPLEVTVSAGIVVAALIGLGKDA